MSDYMKSPRTLQKMEADQRKVCNATIVFQISLNDVIRRCWLLARPKAPPCLPETTPTTR